MRPVHRGISPSQFFSHYREAAQPLIERLGSYCSYCERHIETHLAVEHISPKSVDAEREKDWSNFLLGCVNCNSGKGKTPVNASEYFWPDSDNTLETLVYLDALVMPSPGLNSEQKKKAESIIRLVGLDRDPGNPDKTRRPSKNDNRWNFRKDRWGLAKSSRERLQKKDSPELREQIIETALGRGGFGIWFTVFSDDEDMRRRLVEAFPGTAKYYFNQFANLAMPVHVLRVLDAVIEEIDHSDNKYVMQVVLPTADDYQRISINWGLKGALESAARRKESAQLGSRSVWLSMIEYPAIPAISRNKITAVVFEQRQLSSLSYTKTRHYVEPSYEGQDIVGITYRAMASIANDISNFFATGIPPS
jgi:uncharacterized protein (TIGR02646 family)